MDPNEPTGQISEEEYRRRVLQLLETIMGILEEIRDSISSTEAQLTGPGVRIRS